VDGELGRRRERAKSVRYGVELIMDPAKDNVETVAEKTCSAMLPEHQ